MPQLDILISGKGTSQSKLDRGQPNGGISASVNLFEDNNSKLSMFQSVAMNRLVMQGINITKTVVNDAVSMHGDMTGEYLKQTKIENVFKAVGGVADFAGGLVSGAMVGGFVGFTGAAVVQTGNLVYQGITNNFKYNASIVKSNIQAQFNSQRIGNVLIGGGRI